MGGDCTRRSIRLGRRRRRILRIPGIHSRLLRHHVRGHGRSLRTYATILVCVVFDSVRTSMSVSPISPFSPYGGVRGQFQRDSEPTSRAQEYVRCDQSDPAT